MKIVNATDFKNKFGYYVDTALANDEIYLSRYGHVVAKVEAVKDEEALLKQRDASLITEEQK